jgi:hypothetical protein
MTVAEPTIPAWYVIYAILLGMLLVGNIVYAVKSRCHLLWLAHDLLSGAFFLAFAAAYWQEPLRAAVTPLHVPLFAFLLLAEFRLTLAARPGDYGINLPEGVGERELDMVKALSILVFLPAYIVGTLLCSEILGRM